MNIYFPAENSDTLEDISILDLITKVLPLYGVPSSRREHIESYYRNVQHAIADMMPAEALEQSKLIKDAGDSYGKKKFYKALMENCPLMKANFYTDEDGITLSIATLCKSSYSREVGRFICDYFSKWLLPGKIVHLSHVHSALVQFKELPKRGFFFHEVFIQIENSKHLLFIQANIEEIIKEIKINILAVSHARRVVSVNSLTEEQKKIIIQENISELLDIPSKGYNHNLFEQMQHFLLKAASEEKISRIKETLSPLIDLKPQVFERDLFNEIQRFVLPSTKDFTTSRKTSHVTRVIAYAYLLRKRASYAFVSNPQERFAVTKVLRTSLASSGPARSVVGILAAVNYSSESEIFDERHLFEAALSIVPRASVVENSLIHNKREYTGTRIIYIEIEKINERFTSNEIKGLQENLTDEVLSKVECVTSTIFMPRNEEEILRNVLTLSNQLRFPSDLPQVMINYESQEKSSLLFTVLLVRIEQKDSPKITEKRPRKKQIWIKEKEEKTVGKIRKKLTKKAYILEVSCPKVTYLRKDFSLDLTRARRDVFTFISNIAGEIRDFNGGMIAKQNEVLVDLKRQLIHNDFSDDFILENFFYSFTPRFMQCLLPATSLKHSFLLFQEALEHDFSKSIYFIKTITWESYMILTVATINSSFKEFIDERIVQIDFDPSSLALSYTKIHDIPVLSYVLNFSDPIQSDKLLKTLVEGIKEWKASLTEPLITH